MKTYSAIRVVVTTLVWPISATAQTASDSTTQADRHASGNTFVPLPALFYQTETGTGFGAVATYYFRSGGAPVDQDPSYVAPIAIYTTKRQIIANIDAQVYTDGGRWWWVANTGFIRFPTKFWGIGNDAAEAAEEDYTPDQLNLAVDAQRVWRPGLYVGFTSRVAHRRLRSTAPDGLLAGSAVPGAVDGRFVGIGPLATWDTRDDTVYPRAGGLHQARIASFHPVWGSDFEFTTITLDVRRYLTVNRSHVIALRGLGIANAGSPPFDAMGLLGGDRVLRGYYQGRFRDRHLLAAQTEYRFPVVWRVGLVGFAAVGQVANRLDGFGRDRFKYAVGGGLRFLMSPGEGLNLRADFAWGLDVKSTGFYLGIGETF